MTVGVGKTQHSPPPHAHTHAKQEKQKLNSTDAYRHPVAQVFTGQGFKPGDRRIQIKRSTVTHQWRALSSAGSTALEAGPSKVPTPTVTQRRSPKNKNRRGYPVKNCCRQNSPFAISRRCSWRRSQSQTARCLNNQPTTCLAKRIISCLAQ